MTRKTTDATGKCRHLQENATDDVHDLVAVIYGYVVPELGRFVGLPRENFFQRKSIEGFICTEFSKDVKRSPKTSLLLRLQFAELRPDRFEAAQPRDCLVDGRRFDGSR